MALVLMPRVVVFTDRHGDVLSVIPRDRSDGGNPIPDPIITVTCGGRSQSVVFTDEDVPQIIAELVVALGLDAGQLLDIADLVASMEIAS